MLDEKLLSILVCPKCQGQLVDQQQQSRLLCNTCQGYYRIEDDIPVMLAEELIPLETEEEAPQE